MPLWWERILAEGNEVFRGTEKVGYRIRALEDGFN